MIGVPSEILTPLIAVKVNKKHQSVYVVRASLLLSYSSDQLLTLNAIVTMVLSVQVILYHIL
jgi:hypothetical protein